MSTAADAPRRPGRPATLSRERIVAAVASSDDLDALTMRDLAARLEVRHGALYRWVRNRDELFEMISAVVVDRVVSGPLPDGPDWRPRLRHLAWSMHEHVLAFRGYASHLARPHPHHVHTTDRLREAVVGVFTDAGVPAGLADRSWFVFVTATIGWLAQEEQPVIVGHDLPSFGQFLDVLLRGLPVRAPDETGDPARPDGSG